MTRSEKLDFWLGSLFGFFVTVATLHIGLGCVALVVLDPFLQEPGVRERFILAWAFPGTCILWGPALTQTVLMIIATTRRAK